MTRRTFTRSVTGAAVLSALPSARAAGESGWTAETAARFAKLALSGTTREFPHKLDHVMNDAVEVKNPRELHPAFYGCFDWHSSVHGHWLLARVRRAFPDLPESREAMQVLEANLSPANIAVETAYLEQKSRGSFERTYGWAWLLKLQEELRRGTDEASRRHAAALEPLAAAFVTRYLRFLPKQTYPIRHGVHPNTAFGLMFAWDYARASGRKELENLCAERAKNYFAADTAYPAQYEPCGEDFFSPALLEADMMRRVMTRDAFGEWFTKFLPGAASGQPGILFEPATVTDRSDLKIVHLDGLNLSRAWSMRCIAAGLPEVHPARAALLQSAQKHLDASLPHVTSGDFAGEHWLATFAVLAISAEGA